MNMDFKKYNNLIDLFFEQYTKQLKDKIFLSSLKDPKKIFLGKMLRQLSQKFPVKLEK